MIMKVYKGTTAKITFYLEKPAGTVWPELAGATVTLTTATKEGVKKIDAGPCDVEDAATGEISYSEAGTGLDTPDVYDAQFKVVIAAKDDYSDIFDLEVRDTVG